MPAEQIGLELLAQGFDRQVLDGAGLRMRAIVVERVERSAGPLQHRRHQRLDRLRLAIVEIERLDAVGGERSMSCGLRAVANTRQPSRFSARAQ